MPQKPLFETVRCYQYNVTYQTGEGITSQRISSSSILTLCTMLEKEGVPPEAVQSITPVLNRGMHIYIEGSAETEQPKKRISINEEDPAVKIIRESLNSIQDKINKMMYLLSEEPEPEPKKRSILLPENCANCRIFYLTNCSKVYNSDDCHKVLQSTGVFFI